jgi:antitoxin component YwqK of YwqJK toxin-antitoxin module
MPQGYEKGELAVQAPGVLDLHGSTYEELSIARVYTRHKQQLSLLHGYNSEEDVSDEDEEDGSLHTDRTFHDNGQQKYKRTYQKLTARGDLPACERIVEEKHFNPAGVCMLDIHFGLGQPYLSRKHFYENQRLKSEQLFFVEDERTMKARKAGHWRDYYDGGNIKSEMQYDQNGVRCGFCKRYNNDGSLEWVKDYTKDYIERVSEFNSKKGRLDFTEHDAAALLGFQGGVLPQTAAEVNREYRKHCAPLHPDKTSDPDATEKFIEVSRARDLLLKAVEERGKDPQQA